MDFQKVLDALDQLIDTKVQAAAYTRMLTAIVQGIEDSEKNTYNVTYDNGKTNVIAISVAPNDGEIQYRKGDSVQLLQYNGVGNTNTILYILGKSENISKQDLADLDEWFNMQGNAESLNQAEGDGTFKPSATIIENIKKYGSFILKGTFSAAQKLDASKNYGFKIILNFTKDSNIPSVEYIFDTYQMIGQPWLYSGVTQEFKRTIDDDKLPYLDSIAIEKINKDNFTCTNLELASAILTIANEYTAQLKGAVKGVDFITKNQNGKVTTTLQAEVYKNNQVFASSSCKYYWFVKDESIVIGDKQYCQYGGAGWRCLNDSEDLNYIDGTSEKIFKNNIGDILTINQENALAYHNYYKCVVKYGARLAETEEKEILNLDKTNLTFSLTASSKIITELNDNSKLVLTINYIQAQDIVKQIKWKYRKDNEEQEYECSANSNIIIEDNTLIVKGEALRNQLGINYTKYTCILLNNNNNTLGTASIIITRDLTNEKVEEIWYYNNGASITPPEKPDETPSGSWTNIKPADTSDEVKNNYIFAVSRIVSYGTDNQYIYTGPFGDVYCYSAHGLGAAAAQLTEFNRLTNNGKDRGLFYGSGYIKTTDTTKQSDKTYYYFDTETKGFVELKGAFQSGVEYYEKFNDDQALYINADYINTGTLRVGDTGSEKFYASINSQNVKIGGFTVNDTDLQWNNGSERVYLGREGLQLGGKFSIDQNGNVSWNANNSPIRQIYCRNNTAALPANQEEYNKLFDSSATQWHKKKDNDNDIYYAQSSDGGATWTDALLIQGKQGPSGASSYVLQISSPIHCGKNQNNAITIKLMSGTVSCANWKINVQEVGATEAIFSDRIGSGQTTYTLTADIIQKCSNDIEITATWSGVKVDQETITYSPQNSPVLDLSNDSATLAYASDGFKIGTDTVSSIPKLFLNGEIIITNVIYNWYMNYYDTEPKDRTPLNESSTDGATVKDNIITVNFLLTETATFTCVATYKGTDYIKDFTVTKVFKGDTGVAGTSPCMLQISSPIHCGAKQKSDITIQLKQGTTLRSSYSIKLQTKNSVGQNKVITTSGVVDLSPVEENNWIKITTVDGYELITNLISKCAGDIIVIAKWGYNYSTVLDQETITYSPQNSPVLDLTNDSATLAYSSDGSTKIGTDTVSSTATLYLNGEPIPTTNGVEYNWNNNINTDIVEQATIEVETVSNNKTINSVIWTCTATYDGGTYTKTFTITKALRGNDGAKGADGEPGKDGADGKPGKDGLQVTEILYALGDNDTNAPQDDGSNWKPEKPELREDKPFLWEKRKYNDGSETTFILEWISEKTFIKYADMDMFKFTTSTDTDGNTVTIIQRVDPNKPVKIYDTPKETTGWMGVCVGRYKNAPSDWEKYEWSYYIAQVNRSNFMTNVLKTEVNNVGDYVDGIYTVKGNDGQNYIGINASAIMTGYLEGEHIKVGTLNGDRIIANTITADKIKADQLSAISADLGTVTAGEIRSTNYNLPIIWSEEFEGTPGLEYELDSDLEYKCTGIGTASTTDIVIASTYAGLPVVKVGDSAFFKSNITSVKIGNNITSIVWSAFQHCSKLKYIYIGGDVATISNGAFSQNPNNLENIKVSSQNTVFTSKNNCLIKLSTKAIILGCKNSVIPSSEDIEIIDSSSFENILDITSIIIPNNIKTISSSSFSGCSKLEKIILGSGITKIESSAFLNCTSLKEVYYNGTEAQWNKITITATNNQKLLNAKKYYFSTDGTIDNSWHLGKGFKISMNDDNMIESPNFIVSQDGIINATNAKLSGYIEATAGLIGGFQIQDQGLSSDNISFSSDGINIKNDSGMITLQDFIKIGYQKINNNTYPGVLINPVDKTVLIGTTYVDNSDKLQYSGFYFTPGTQLQTTKDIVFKISNFAATATGGGSKKWTITFNCDNGGSTLCSQTILFYIHFRWLAAFSSNYSDEEIYKGFYLYHNHAYSNKLFTWELEVEDPVVLIQNCQICVDFADTEGGGVAWKWDWKDIYGVNSISFQKTVHQTLSTASAIELQGTLYPRNDKGGALGAEKHRWSAGYFVGTVNSENGTTTISDRTVKTNISNLNNIEQYSLFFDYLEPVKYQFIEGVSGRYHTGFISQDIEQAIEKAGLTTQDFAGFVKDKDDDGNEHYYLRYEEFIALNTDQIQKLKKRIAELEKQIKEIKGEN